MVGGPLPWQSATLRRIPAEPGVVSVGGDPWRSGGIGVLVDEQA